MWPDIDKKNTYISNRLPLLAQLFRHTSHRGATHSLVYQSLFVLGLSILGLGFWPQYWTEIASGLLGISLGLLSHDFYDLITVAGLQLLQPFSDHTFHLGHLNGKRDGWWVALLSFLIAVIFFIFWQHYYII